MYNLHSEGHTFLVLCCAADSRGRGRKRKRRWPACTFDLKTEWHLSGWASSQLAINLRIHRRLLDPSTLRAPRQRRHGHGYLRPHRRRAHRHLMKRGRWGWGGRRGWGGRGGRGDDLAAGPLPPRPQSGRRGRRCRRRCRRRRVDRVAPLLEPPLGRVQSRRRRERQRRFRRVC